MDARLDAMGAGPATGRARAALLKRLIDVVAMPGSRIAPSDRAMAGDILLEMLLSASHEERLLCAERLAERTDAPRRVLRYLACAPIEIARRLLEMNDGLDASDLAVAARVSLDHRLLVAERKDVGPLLAEHLCEFGEAPVVRKLLSNRAARLSEAAVDAAVILSQTHTDLCDLLLDREELVPSQAMAMFWWSDGDVRKAILQRQSADRLELIVACADVFSLAAAEQWADPLTRKTLQLIERRQRNRSALEKSPFDSLEHAVETAAEAGMDAELAQEIGYLAGMKPVTIAKLLSDLGGEGVAVLCKGTGLKRSFLEKLWQGLRRPLTTETGAPHPHFERVLLVFQLLTVAKAQTTLRYWNWSMSSGFSPVRGLPEEEEPDLDEGESFSIAQRTARLVFGR